MFSETPGLLRHDDVTTRRVPVFAPAQRVSVYRYRTTWPTCRGAAWRSLQICRQRPVLTRLFCKLHSPTKAPPQMRMQPYQSNGSMELRIHKSMSHLAFMWLWPIGDCLNLGLNLQYSILFTVSPCSQIPAWSLASGELCRVGCAWLCAPFLSLWNIVFDPMIRYIDTSIFHEGGLVGACHLNSLAQDYSNTNVLSSQQQVVQNLSAIPLDGSYCKLFLLAWNAIPYA